MHEKCAISPWKQRLHLKHIIRIQFLIVLIPHILDWRRNVIFFSAAYFPIYKIFLTDFKKVHTSFPWPYFAYKTRWKGKTCFLFLKAVSDGEWASDWHNTINGRDASKRNAKTSRLTQKAQILFWRKKMLSKYSILFSRWKYEIFLAFLTRTERIGMLRDLIRPKSITPEWEQKNK